MGQDMVKGRRTEIDFLNGFVVSKGEGVAMRAAANAALTGWSPALSGASCSPTHSTSPVCG